MLQNGIDTLNFTYAS